MAGETEPRGIKERLSRQGEEALGRVAEELAANPIVTSAIAGAFEARERAVAAQEAAMGALGIPSAADIERLTRRVRSVSQRLEGIEDALDRLDERLGAPDVLGDQVAATDALGGDGLDRRLDELKGEISALKHALAPPTEQVPRAQERLAVPQAEAPGRRRRESATKSGGGSARKSTGSTARKPRGGSARKSTGSTARKPRGGSARKSTGSTADKPAGNSARKR